MKKLKVLIASMIGAIALVFACVVGVHAADAVQTQSYSWKPENMWTTSTKGAADTGTYNIYSSPSTATAQRNAFGSLVSSGLTNSYSETKTWTYELRYYGGTILQVTIGDNQKADYEIYAYTSKSNNARTITVGSNTAHSLRQKVVERFTGSVDGGTSSIAISGDQVVLLEVNFTVSNSSSTKTLDRITISNSKTYYSGDTVLASDFTVTGIYVDDSTQEESSKTLDSATYTVVVKKDNVAVANNVLVTGGAHVAVITVNDTQVSNTFDFTVNVATHGNGNIFNPSNLTAESFASGRIIDGTMFKILSTDASKVRIDANNKSIDDFSFTKRLVFGGKASTTSCALLVKAPSAGKLVVYGMSNSANSERTLGLYTAQLGNVDVDGFTNDGNEIAKYEYNLTSGGDYLLGAVSGGFSIYYVAFEAEVTALQQEAVSGESTYVRFVFIVRDATLTTADFANKLTLILDDGLESKQTVTRSPKAYNKLTLGGNTYSATVNGSAYNFDNSENSNDIYVVYVVKFTTITYSGHNVKASLNYGGTEYKTSGYDFE